MEIKLPVGLVHDGEIHRDVVTTGVTGKVMRKLSSMQGKRSEALKTQRKALEMLIKGFKGIDGSAQRLIDDLYYVDGEYLLHEVARREFADEQAEVTRTCNNPNCGAQNAFKLDLDEIEVIDMHEDNSTVGFEQEGNGFRMKFELEHGVPTSDKTDNPDAKFGELGLITMSEFQEIVSGKQGGGQQQGGGVDFGQARFDQLFHTIKSLEYFTVPGEEHDSNKDRFTKTDLDKMRHKDIKKLENMYNENLPGVQYPQSRACEVCGSDIPLGVDPVTDFFL